MTPRLHPEFLSRPLAHRALHDVGKGRPENSRAAIVAAMDAGYGIEIDLQLSADGQAMVFHDDALDRLAEATGPVRARSAAELAETVLIGSAEGVPTLQEVLALVGGRVPVLIELKDQDGAMGTDIGALERATAQCLADYKGPVGVMSFNPNSVACMAEILPSVPRGIVTSAYDATDWAPLPPSVCDALRPIPDFDRVAASFISHEVSDLDRPRVAELKAQGADVLCWTVKSLDQEKLARRIAQNITFEGYLAATLC